jgi:hypothetical protein
MKHVFNSLVRRLRGVRDLLERSRIGRAILFRWEDFQWRRRQKRWEAESAQQSQRVGDMELNSDAEINSISPSGRRRR